MPIDDLTALGQKMREARKKKDLTQQELADLSHVSVKQIANIEKGKMNPSYLILRALAKVLHISLDTLINPDISYIYYREILPFVGTPCCRLHWKDNKALECKSRHKR